MKPIQLTIPTPCHESWDAMTPKDQGRFCASCSKVVVDFSAMSDAQMIAYFENLKTENVCGRVYPDQLNRTLEPVTVMQPRKKIAWFWQVAAAFSLFFFKGQMVKAQGKVAVRDTTKKIQEINDIPIRLGGIRRVHPDTVAKIPAKLTQIFITDENNHRVPFASVQLLPEGKWLVADGEGKINLDKDHTVEILKISAAGYEEKVVLLKELESNNVKMNLLEVLMGEVVVLGNFKINSLQGFLGGIGVKRTQNIEKQDEVIPIADKTSKSGLTVFPNPASKGQYITMNIEKNKSTEFSLLITDASGKTMLQQNINIVSKTQPIKFMVPANWASGQYFISIRSSKEETMQTAAMLVL